MGSSPIVETASAGASGECTGSDGLIDPAGFACGASDLQPSRVEMAADDLTRLGAAVRWEVTGVASEWAGMRPWYVAPERDRLLALMDAPADDARRLEDDLRAAARLLVTYAAELVTIQRTLADLEWRASRFRERVRHGVMVPASESGRPTLLQAVLGLVGGVEPEVLVYWRESAAAVAENDALLAEYGQIVERLTTAADEVENGIRALLADSALVEDTHPIPAEAFDASYIEMPWGWPAKEEMNVVEDIADGGRRVWEGLVAFLPLLGVDPATGVQSIGTAVQAWLGMGNLFGSMAIAAAYPEARWAPSGLAQLPWMQERYHTAESAGLMVGYDAAAADAGESAWHQWRDNPWATGMETGFNVLSMVAPSAGAARFAGLSARTARWARITGLGADFLVPGGSFAVAGAARVTGNLADLARFGDHLPGLSIRPAGVIDGAAEVVVHTPASDHFFGSTTAERPGGLDTADETTGSGADAGTPADATGFNNESTGRQPTAQPLEPADPGTGGTNGGGGGGEGWSGAADDGGARPLTNDEFTALSPPERLAYAHGELTESARAFIDETVAIEYGRDVWAHIEDDLTSAQREAIHDYTRETPGTSRITYEHINTALRAGPPYPAHLMHHIRMIDEALGVRPLDEAVLVDRGVDLNCLPRRPDLAVGQMQRERGFMSTALHGTDDVVGGYDAVLHLSAPKGTPALWVERVGALGVSERELLLGRGLTWVLRRAVKIDGQWHIFGEVVG